MPEGSQVLASFFGNGDSAGGPQSRITLSAPGRLPKVCCQLPCLLMIILLGALLGSAVIWPPAFFALTAMLTFYVGMWSLNLAVSSCIGAWHLRRDTARDWHGTLQNLQKDGPDRLEATHIVILPNFKEDQQMLKHTLENLARSPMARQHVRIVLAMEEREEGSRQKAEELIKETSGLFADMIATHHPANLPGDLAGKSSNTQWALRKALATWAPFLAKRDASRVFITVGDADTQWHPQYLCAVAAQGLQMSVEKRSWTIWQPPVMLLRNLWTVPGVTRVSSYATLMYELAGLANQAFGTHLCYSAYSLTMALAAHRLVGGWDTDVIAEDHHMFLKCYFASMRAEKEKKMPVAPTLQLSPVYLPADSYLVESTDGYWASCTARFQQARRHAQGVSEISYIFLQYMHLMSEVGLWKTPMLTHLRIFAVALKLSTIHIINSVQAMSLVIAGIVCVNWGVSWLATTGLEMLASGGLVAVLCEIMRLTLESFLGKTLLAAFGPLQIFFVVASFSQFLVINDALEGRYVQPMEKDALRAPTAWNRLTLALKIQGDMATLAEPTIVVYGMIPELMACWSLLRRGTKFDYIVAAKPEGGR